MLILDADFLNAGCSLECKWKLCFCLLPARSRLPERVPVLRSLKQSQMERRTFEVVVSPAPTQSGTRGPCRGHPTSVAHPPPQIHHALGLASRKGPHFSLFVLNVEGKTVRNLRGIDERSTIRSQGQRGILCAVHLFSSMGLRTGSAAGFTGGKATTKTDCGL